MEAPEKGAPIIGRGLLRGSGTEVEAQSSMHDKCQEMAVVGLRLAGGEVDHLHGHQGHGHRSGRRPHQEDLMTGEVLIEGLQTEGRRPGGLQTGEGRLLEDEFSLHLREEGPLWRGVVHPKPDDYHLWEDQDFIHLHLSAVVPGKGTGANREVGRAGEVTPDRHPPASQTGVEGPTTQDQDQVRVDITVSLILAMLSDRWNNVMKILSASE